MKNKGFTLLEVLITSLVIGFMFAGIMYFIANSNKVLDASVKQSFAYANSIRILNMLARDIREGAVIETVPPGLTYPSYNFKIKYPDRTTEHIWGIKYIPQDNGKYVYRIMRDGQVIPFIGDISEVYNYNIVRVLPNNEGKYFSADISFQIYTNEGGSYALEEIKTKSYCRHDWTGYFDPQEVIQ
ncbi:MAG: prepilin-type N-terminal cleavage/methylation domain-containing protein [Candidatus Delongbacteria bacterium]|nr:prepilin-type N-terminal cleavage/methylation domain-containing protein [Candidatus Delongbacteria bacterium]